MSNEQPTPPPVAYETPPPPAAPTGEMDPGLQFAADKIGFVPNMRKSDNIFQLKFIGVTCLLCVVLALIAPMGDFPVLAKIATGLLAGLLVGVILSGIILAIKNLKR